MPKRSDQPRVPRALGAPWLLGALVFAACGRVAPQPAPPRAAAKGASPTSIDAAAETPPRTVETHDAGSPDASDARTSAEATAEDATFDEKGIEAWLTRAGITGKNAAIRDRLYGCRPVTVGLPRREAALCANAGPPMAASYPSGESVFPLVVFVAEGGAVHTALEIPLTARALDSLDDDSGSSQYVALEARLSPDGMTIVVEENKRPDASCAAARAALAGPSFQRHRRMVDLACRSIGTYTWRAGRFVRAAAPTPAPAPAPAAGGGHSSF
ncbi:MAG: hypothetical protein U0183_25525 [Polyangiaceae bacterium]